MPLCFTTLAFKGCDSLALSFLVVALATRAHWKTKKNTVDGLCNFYDTTLLTFNMLGLLTYLNTLCLSFIFFISLVGIRKVSPPTAP